MIAGMLVLALGAFLVSLCLSLAFVAYSSSSLLDQPSWRSNHSKPTSRLGGLAAMAGAVVGAVISFQLTLSAVVVLGCALALGVVGLLDDNGYVAVRFRLMSQFGIGVIGALSLAFVGTGFSLLWIPVAAFFVAAYVNAFNFMDGVNGISGLNAIVAGLAFTTAGADAGSRPVILLGVTVAASAAGFLLVNGSGRLFLGDGGSYFIGTLIALTVIVGIADGLNTLLLVAPLLIYFVDTGLTLIRRGLRGENLAQAHSEHIYQRLLGGQWGHGQSATLTAIASGVCCVAAWVAVLGTPVIGAVMAASAVLAYVLAPAWVDSNQSSTVAERTSR